MKKLKRFVLNPSCHSLDIGAMTGIVGGFSARSTSCGTSCGSYPSIYISPIVTETVLLRKGNTQYVLVRLEKSGNIANKRMDWWPWSPILFKFIFA